MIRRSALAFLFLLPSIGWAQDWFFNAADIHKPDSLPKKGFLLARYQVGKLTAPETRGIKYIEANPFQAIDFRVGLLGYGRKKWHELHRYPNYGLGVSKFWFSPTNNILGNPATVYLFFNEPLARSGRSSLGYDFSLGLSYHWKPYDAQSNPEQLAIGSSINFIVGLALQYEYKLSSHVDLAIGPRFTHFSNGRTRSPNRGLNLFGFGATIRYKLKPLLTDNIHYPIEPFKPMYEFYIVGNTGIVTTFKNIDKPGIYFWAASASIDVARHYGYNGKYGVGLDWFFDASLKELYESQYPAGVPSRLLYWPGAHISHEYMIHRWTFITQAGLNLKVKGDKGSWYGRIALRYDLSEHVFVRLGLRVYDVFISDFIETGLGYAMYRGRK